MAIILAIRETGSARMTELPVEIVSVSFCWRRRMDTDCVHQGWWFCFLSPTFNCHVRMEENWSIPFPFRKQPRQGRNRNKKAKVPITIVSHAGGNSNRFSRGKLKLMCLTELQIEKKEEEDLE